MNDKKNAFCVLMVITSPKLARRALFMFQHNGVPVQYEWNARGTASSEMMDVLGLGTPDKNLIVSVLPKTTADEMAHKLKKGLKLGTVNSGIAFTVNLSGASAHLVRILESQEKAEDAEGAKKVGNAEGKFSLIAAVVNQGYSDNVMDAAREAGAGGGTVVPSRCIGAEEARGLWGFTLQDERDIVFIVAKGSNKLAIMQAIGEKCGMHSDAKGIVVSVPLDSVMGIDTED